MIKLYCCHNLLQLQGTICFGTVVSTRDQSTANCTNLFFWLSYTDQSNNTQIIRTGNNNNSITIINNNNYNNNNNNIYDNKRSNRPFLDVVSYGSISWKKRIYIIDYWYDQSGPSEQYFSQITLPKGIRLLSTNIAHCEVAISKAYVTKN